MPEVNFDTEIIRITNEVLSSGTIEQIMREKITKGFEDSIASSFRYGELSSAIEARVKEVLVPYVERYDMSKYMVKLDELLGQVVEQTALNDNRKLLENFKGLMIAPVGDTITLDDLFKRYRFYVAANIDTSNLEVDDDEGPMYEYVLAMAEIKEDERPYRFYSSFSYRNLYLHVDDSDDLCFNVRLSRWDNDKKEGFDISYDVSPSISGLSSMSDFEVYLCALTKAGVKLTFDHDYLEDYVRPDAEPEPTYQ